MQPIEEQLAAMQRRLDRLEAERDILNLFARYGHTVDEGNEQGWVDCFTENGGFSASGPDAFRAPISVSGRSALFAFAAGHSRRPHRFHVHCILDSNIEISDDASSAKSTSYMFTMMRWNKFAEEKEVPVIRAFGRYTDALVKESDGAWRLLSRHADLYASDRDLPPLAGGRPKD